MTDLTMPWTMRQFGIAGSDEDKIGPWRSRCEVDVDVIDDPLELCATCQNLYIAGVAKKEVGTDYKPILLCAPCSKPYFKKLKAAKDAKAEVDRRKDVRTIEQRFLQNVQKGWHPTSEAANHPVGLLLPNGKVVYTEAKIRSEHQKVQFGTFGQEGLRTLEGRPEYVEVRIPEVRVMMTVEEFHHLSGWAQSVDS